MASPARGAKAKLTRRDPMQPPIRSAEYSGVIAPA